MARRILLLLASWLAFNAPTFGQNNALEGNFRISGTVVHAQTGAPLRRVEVSLNIMNQADPVRSVFSDAQGHFVFDHLAAGKYGLAGQKHGFARQGYEQHENFWTGIAVGANFQSEGIVFRLFPDAAISGVISDNQGDAVGGAEVLLFRRGVESGRIGTIQEQDITADEEGHYHFTHLQPGTYFIAVFGEPWYAGMSREMAHSQLDMAYPATFYPGVTDSKSATAITVNSGDQVKADILLTAVPGVHLQVRPPIGKYSSYEVNIEQRLFGTYSLSVKKESTQYPQELKLSGLTPGEFIIHVQPEDSDTSWSQPLTLSADIALDASLGTASGLTGTVKLAGQYMSGQALVRLHNLDTDAMPTAPIKPDGQFTFTDVVEPGNYEVIVDGIADAAIQQISAVGADTKGLTLHIERAGTVQLNIVLSLGLAQVEGFAEKDGKPASQTMILLVPEDFEHCGSNIRRDQSDSDGTFTLRDAPPGKYRVVAIQNGWDLAWTDPAVLKPYLQHAEPLRVVANQKYKVRVQVQGPANQN